MRAPTISTDSEMMTMATRSLPEWLVNTLRGGGERATSTLKHPSQELRQALGVSDITGDAATAEAAMRHADVFACIRVLADSVGSLPLIVYRRTDQGRERAAQSLAGQLLHRPAPNLTQAAFISTVMAHLASWGNAFVAKYRQRPGSGVQQLGIIHPRRVSVGLKNGEPQFKVEGVDGVLNRRDIIHIMGMSFDGVIGVAPITQARSAIGVGVALEEQAAAFLKNRATPAGVLKVKDELSDEAFDRLKKTWQTMFSGRNTGRTAILEDGVEWQAVSLPAKDVQFIEQRRLSSTQIARIFRVPPYMIGADNGASMTYSNVEQETLQLVTHTLRPWMVAIEQAIGGDEDLFAPGGDLYPEFLIDALLRADTKTRFEAYALALAGKPFMAQNEVRRRENLTTQDGGDLLNAPPEGNTTP